ncbi:hypothetical protein LMG28614_06106 [Paraburkholderia ultramafica]|uniref:Uncharacterized protein n=1 Tax=Paraburkholderia ultramafica TaxID=1544867 RepID=A0A6S7DGA8_9BURK|nr:hypothetical protein [Paraburkholderia ultramafica]CAB3804961.1 hypothetical protein LMG28614_06106 [Paraburkholderia ultramafica]
MDAIVHTSPEPELAGRMIVEGMAAARPVITAAGGVTQIVRHDRDGWRLKAGDAAASTNATGTLRADPAVAQHFAKRGAERCAAGVFSGVVFAADDAGNQARRVLMQTVQTVQAMQTKHA